MRELTELLDAVSEQGRIEAAGGWVTALRETVRPRLGSVVLPAVAETVGETGDEARGELNHMESGSGQVRLVCGQVIASGQSMMAMGLSNSLSEQSQLLNEQSQSLCDHLKPYADHSKAFSNQTTSFSNQTTPTESTHSPSTNTSLPMIVTGPPSHPTNTMPPPTRSLRRGGNCKYYVNGELEVARSLGDFGFKLGRLRERTWNYPSQRREMLGAEGFVADVVSNVPFVKWECGREMSVRSQELRKEDRFIVMATDGLWEVINPKACLKIVMKMAQKYSLDMICRVLLWIALKRKSTDNISIVVVDLCYCNVGSMISRKCSVC